MRIPKPDIKKADIYQNHPIFETMLGFGHHGSWDELQLIKVSYLSLDLRHLCVSCASSEQIDFLCSTSTMSFLIYGSSS